jgi:FkbM family methyltransferase
VRHSYGGFPLHISLEDVTAKQWYDMDWGELPEIAMLRRHKLQPGARVIDVGAHQGVVALMLANIVGPTGLIVAVEPDAWNLRVARKNQKLNQADNLVFVQAVATDTDGKLVVNEAARLEELDSLMDWDLQGLNGVSLDNLASAHGQPDILFIDVDGFECSVLRGARQTLLTHPDCFVEIHVGVGLEKQGGSVDEVFSYFPMGQYDFFIASEKEREFVPFKSNSPLLDARFFLVAIARA